jgi:hypothetical protein
MAFRRVRRMHSLMRNVRGPAALIVLLAGGNRLAAATTEEPPIALQSPAAIPTPTGEPSGAPVEGVAHALFNPAGLANYAQAPAEDPEEIAAEEGDVTRIFRPITQLTASVAAPDGLLPGQPGTEQPGFTPSPPLNFPDARLWRGWARTDYGWAATGLCHRPLYFEEVNLERYGYTLSPVLQPAISGAHFFLTIPTLPYKMTRQCPRECVYTLGHYRPGSPAPWRKHCMDLAWDPTAATVQGLIVTGLVFAIP